MPDEITIKPKATESSSAVSEPQQQTISITRTTLINLCAAGLGVSFFLPWARFLGADLSGLELQKMGQEHRLLWAIPAFCVITIIAGVTKRSQMVVGQLSGALPFIAAVWWYLKIRDDLFHLLAYGGILSLSFGLVLLLLAGKSK